MTDALWQIEAAIRALPSADAQPSLDVVSLASSIWWAADRGWLKGSTGRRSTTPAATRKELATLARKADALAAHVRSLHAPAAVSVSAEGVDLDDLCARMQNMAEAAKRGQAYVAGVERGRGRPPDQLASDVTARAMEVFKSVTGRELTYTTAPVDSARKVIADGDTFLRAIFDALGIKASVLEQIVAARKTAARSAGCG